MDIIKKLVKIGIKSKLIRRMGSKIAINLLPEEFETTVGNSRFVFRPKKDGLWFLNYAAFAEPGVEKVLCKYLREGDTFVDVGAYIGYYTIFARNLVGESGKIIAFEPNPISFKLLKKNIDLNGYYNCILENIALSENGGKAKLFIGKFTDADSSLIPLKNRVNRSYYNIVTTEFDKYSKLHNIIPDMIKIDVEGSEYYVLKSMKNTLALYHPKILIEIHSNNLNKIGVTPSYVIDFLLKKEYKIQLVTNEKLREIPTRKLLDIINMDRENSIVKNQILFCK